MKEKIKEGDYVFDFSKEHYGEIGKVKRITEDSIYILWINYKECEGEGYREEQIKHMYHPHHKGLHPDEEIKIITREEFMVEML